MPKRRPTLLRMISALPAGDCTCSAVHALYLLLREGYAIKYRMPEETRLPVGGIDQVKEERREARGVQHMESLLQDLRYGWRMLVKKPHSRSWRC